MCTLVVLTACSTKEEKIPQVQLRFEAKHASNQGLYTVNAQVQLAGMNGATLPDVVQQRVQTILSDSLRHTVGSFFEVYQEVNREDAKFIGNSACEYARLQVKVLQLCTFTQISWAKK